MASMERGASFLQPQRMKFCPQPECAGKWSLSQRFNIRAQPCPANTLILPLWDPGQRTCSYSPGLLTYRNTSEYLPVHHFKWLSIWEFALQQQTIVCLLYVLVAQSCPTLCNPIHRQKPARLLCPSDSLSKNTGVGCHSRGSSQRRDQTWVSCIAGRFFYHLSHQGSPQ